jgi:hypothetical protein
VKRYLTWAEIKSSLRKARNAERSEVDAAVAQLAEQVPCKDKVVGSTPTRGSTKESVACFSDTQKRS